MSKTGWIVALGAIFGLAWALNKKKAEAAATPVTPATPGPSPTPVPDPTPVPFEPIPSSPVYKVGIDLSWHPVCSESHNEGGVDICTRWDPIARIILINVTNSGNVAANFGVTTEVRVLSSSSEWGVTGPRGQTISLDPGQSGLIYASYNRAESGLQLHYVCRVQVSGPDGNAIYDNTFSME